MKLRSDRASKEFQSVLSEIINREIRDPRKPIIASITHVKVSSDLTHATVFVSALGTPTANEDFIVVLKSAVSLLRRELGRRLSLRVVPSLSFVVDNSIVEGARMDAIINKVLAQDRKDGD